MQLSIIYWTVIGCDDILLLFNLLSQNEHLQRAFSGKCPIVGETGCGKTHFMRKLVVNTFFCKLNKVEWVSYIKLDKNWEAEIQSCFESRVELHYPKNNDHFESLLPEFKLHSWTDKSSTKDTNFTDPINSGYGENIKRDRLIVLEDTSGLADTSQKFTSFLTVARKFKYHWVYIFHTLLPGKSIRKSILSQTNILNIFSGICTFN